MLSKPDTEIQVLALWKTEVGGAQIQGQLRDLVKTFLKKKKKKF